MTMQTGTYLSGPFRSDFQINGTSLTAPTSIQWFFPKTWETDGAGFQRQEPFGSCQITWSFMGHSDFTALEDVWDLISGTASVKLPNIYGFPQGWVTFSGVIIDRPYPDNPLFEMNKANVKMTIRKVTINRLTVTP